MWSDKSYSRSKTCSLNEKSKYMHSIFLLKLFFLWITTNKKCSLSNYAFISYAHNHLYKVNITCTCIFLQKHSLQINSKRYLWYYTYVYVENCSNPQLHYTGFDTHIWLRMFCVFHYILSQIKVCYSTQNWFFNWRCVFSTTQIVR